MSIRGTQPLPAGVEHLLSLPIHLPYRANVGSCGSTQVLRNRATCHDSGDLLAGLSPLRAIPTSKRLLLRANMRVIGEQVGGEVKERGGSAALTRHQFSVAVFMSLKQFLPDNVLITTPYGRLKNGHLPLTAVLLTTVLWIFGIVRGKSFGDIDSTDSSACFCAFRYSATTGSSRFPIKLDIFGEY